MLIFFPSFGLIKFYLLVPFLPGLAFEFIFQRHEKGIIIKPHVVNIAELFKLFIRMKVFICFLKDFILKFFYLTIFCFVFSKFDISFKVFLLQKSLFLQYIEVNK